MAIVEQYDAAARRLAPLVQAAANGDASAFGRLVAETQGVVCAISLALTRDAAASEDVAQQVYFDAWRGIGTLRAATSFLPWLRALTRNHSRMAVRTARRLRARIVEIDASCDVRAAAADPPPDALSTLLDDEARVLLAAALDAVPDAAREVLVLYYREGQSVRQVAELLGVREATVKQRLSRARRALRTEYLAHVGELLERSAPNAAFTALVTGGLATAALAASPGVAAAAVLSKGAATAGSGTLSGSTLLSASATGVLGGVGSGLLGLFVGARALWREADSAEEQAAVRRYALSALLASFVFFVVLVSESVRPDGARPLPVTLAALAMQATFMWHHLAALPRARASRVARDMLRDPMSTATREQRRLIATRVGFLVGTLGGGTPVVWLWL